MRKIQPLITNEKTMSRHELSFPGWDAFDLALFDLDGTLLDTLLDIAEAANRALRREGFEPHEVDSYRYLVGSGPDTLFQRAIRCDDPMDPKIKRLLHHYSEECRVQGDRHTDLYPGLEDLLDRLTLAGKSLAILSNKRQSHLDDCVSRFLNRWSWVEQIGSGPHVPKKPDPTGARVLLDRQGCAPKRCVYFGDTDVDMQTAKAAGAYAVGVLWGFRDAVELSEAGADLLINHPAELFASS